MILGLTGGMGCGKSTAGRIFEEFGFTRVDADEVIKTTILHDPEVIDAIREKLGADMLSEEGAINRGALARAVFADEAKLAWLEGLLHPRLYAHWRRLLERQPLGNWLFEVPLLFEKRLENWFDFTICVATTSANQLARLAERGMSQALAEQRISKQLPLAQKIDFADFVVLNDGSHAFLREQIASLIKNLSGRR